tara:strand:+ start:177 stop:434 length:258 start_codon:yes stop_codon:yes gene_type:complete
MKPTSVRLSVKDQVLIDRAASILGLKKSEFIVHSAREAATNAILDERILLANHQQFEEIEAYLNGDDTNDLLERALQKSRENPLW